MVQLWLRMASVAPRRRFAAVLLGAALAGCGPDLGECDMNALGGSDVPGMLAPRAGQIAVNTSCAAGRCHSASATGENRVGAPAGLNFDVVPADPSPAELAKATEGAGVVHDQAEEMWELIDSGDMPPEGQRAPPTAEQKEQIRNWLACGAQVVLAPEQTSGVTPDLPSIFNALTDCRACHSSGTDNAFLQTDACGMYKALVMKPPIGSLCKTMPALTLVAPNNPDGSLFVQKMGTTPPCGSTMPFGATMPLSQSKPALYNAIRTWVMNGAAPPPGCM